MPWPYVEMLPSDVGYADYLAKWRRRRGSKLTPRTKAPTDWEEALKLDIRGARCETGYYLYARPVMWNPFDISRPDFDDFIDVKGVSRFTDHLMIQDGTLRVDCAYQMVFATKHPVSQWMKEDPAEEWDRVCRIIWGLPPKPWEPKDAP